MSRSLKLLAAIVAVAAIPALASAQFTMQGKVTDDAGRPIAGAQLALEGTSIGTATNDEGGYRLVIASPRPGQLLIVRFIGYKPARFTIAQVSGTLTKDFSLLRDVLQLSQLVVTGTRVAAEKSTLGTTLATVNSDAISNSGAAQIDVALSGKVAGALVSQQSGTPGGGTTVRIRGLSTLSRSSEPLYIIDGVIVDNGGTQLIDLGGYSSNRLSDLDPNDIDHIEIVKGAAAAALYGSRANDGVVQIFTKRGRPGALRGTAKVTYATDDAERRVAVNRSPVNAAGAQVQRYDYQDDIFRRAPTVNGSVSMSGGDDKTNFYLSAGLVNQQGIIKSTGYKRENLRLNLDRNVTDWLRLGISTTYIHSDADLQPNGGLTSTFGVLTNFLFTPNSYSLARDPVTGDFPVGFANANPLEVIANWRAPQTIDRAVGGLELTAYPRQGLSIAYRLGYDGYTQNSSQYVPRGSSAPALITGLAISATSRATLVNSDVDVSWITNPMSGVKLTTGTGLNFQSQRFDISSASAQDLALLTSTVQGSQQFASQSVDERRTLGFYGQEQVAINNRLFLTASLRSDASSAFGKTERQQYFPKVGASLDVSEFGFWQRSWLASTVNRFRLRAGYGFSGGQPAGSYQRFSNYIFQAAATKSGIVNSLTQGNEGLKPERAGELETGFDAEVYGGRLGLEFTYFDKKVRDLILPKTVTPSSGFTSQLANVGELVNSGIEVTMRSFNVRRANLTWNTTLTLSTNHPEVTKLSDGGAFFIPESFNVVRVEAGQAPGHFFGTTYVRDAQGRILDKNGAAIQDASGKFIGIPAIGPRRIIGNPNPKAYWSFANDITVHKDWTLRAQFDGVNGGVLFNFDRRLLETPAFGTGKAYESELAGAVPKGFFQARRGIFEEYMESGTFVKFRELSLSYTLDPRWVSHWGVRGAQLQLSGRNLHTWTNYTGWDPESNAGGQRTLVRGFGFGTIPVPRTVALGVTANF